MNNPLRYVARIDIEFMTPFIVGSGERDLEADTAFVADVNGLPAIPGSSLAGVLRSAFKKAVDKETANKLFGWQNGADGCGSRLSISWAVIHDSKGVPVEGRLPDVADDPVLKSALAGTIRDHVRITDRGVAAKHGKFDERAVMAGQRFRFELLLEGTSGDKDSWEQLLRLIKSQTLRIGGKTRRGFGSFKAIAIYDEVFNLTVPQERENYLNLPIEVAKTPIMTELTQDVSSAYSAKLTLKPDGFWMIGGGDDDVSGENGADICPVFDIKIDWSSGAGKEKLYAVIPGTAIKGPLSHRTAFYWNALNGYFSDSDEPGKQPLVEDENTAVKELFGCAKKGKESDKDKRGQRGRVIIDDIYLDEKPLQKYLNHIALDRFTCGPIDGALFTERPFYEGEIPFRIAVNDLKSITDANAKKAFAMALSDLCEGRLAIGSGSGRGNGYCHGKDKAGNKIDWNEWLKGAAA